MIDETQHPFDPALGLEATSDAAVEACSSATVDPLGARVAVALEQARDRQKPNRQRYSPWVKAQVRMRYAELQQSDDVLELPRWCEQKTGTHGEYPPLREGSQDVGRSYAAKQEIVGDIAAEARHATGLFSSRSRSRRLGIDIYGRSIIQFGTADDDGNIDWHPVVPLPAPPRDQDETLTLREALRRVAEDLGTAEISSHVWEVRP